MRKFNVTVVDSAGEAVVKNVEADGFHYTTDQGFFAQRGTAQFYVRQNDGDFGSFQDNIAVFRGVTEVVEVSA
jgi:hypothetical protein